MVGSSRGESTSLARAWWMVIVLFLIYAFSWIDRLTISMLVTPIKASMALTDFQVSLLLGSSFAIAFAVFSVPMGWAADRLARRLVILFGLAVWSLATGMSGFARNFEELLLCRVFVGIGEAALLPAAYSLIGDAFPAHRVTFATSVFQTASKIGTAVAFGLGGVVIATAKMLGEHGWGADPSQYWRLAFVFVGLPGLLLVCLLFTFPEPGRRIAGARPAEAMPLAAFLRERRELTLLLVIAAICIAMVAYSFISWLPTYMERRFGWEPSRYGPALGLMNLCGAAALLGCGRLADHLFARGILDIHLRFPSWAIIALSPVICYAFFATSPWIFLVSYALTQIITIPFVAFMAAIIAHTAPVQLRGRLLGLLMFCYNSAGYAGGPALVGFLTDYVLEDESRLGTSLAIVAISGMALALAALRLALPHLRRAVTARIAASAPLQATDQIAQPHDPPLEPFARG